MINTLTRRIGVGGWRGGLLLVVIALLAFYAGSIRSGVSVHSGVPISDVSSITIGVDGWAYDIPLDVTWFDASGGIHENGRPSCLPPEGTTSSVMFGAIEANRNGVGWRPVVWVDCR